MSLPEKNGRRRQLWVLTGGNGAGKSTFYRMALAPFGVKLINADLIGKMINAEHPENVSYEAAVIAERLIDTQLQLGNSFCFKTVFSHPSKIDLIAKAKGLGYEVILIYVHLQMTQLNEARVFQRVSEGGHSVPLDKIAARIPRTMKNVSVALKLADEARLLDNSLRREPFQQIVVCKKGRCTWRADNLPDWARQMMGECAGNAR